MAESVLRLRVDNKEFDDNIKHATAGVRSMIAEMRKNGEEVNKASADELKFIESLGKMETASGNAKGKLKEMQKALKDLTYEYQQMSDAERKGQIGQAMSKAMQDLKPRIEAAKKEVADMTKAQNTNNASVGNLTSALGINMKSLAGWGAAIGAAKTALSVMGDALMSSETNVDDWGRTVESSHALYEGFIIALNDMDVSGYLNRIDDIVQAAHEAYDALDELSTLSGIRGAERAALGRQITDQRRIIREKGKDSEEGKAAQERLKQLTESMKTSYKNEAADEKKAFEALVDERLAEGGILLTKKSRELFLRTFSSEDAFKQFRSNAKGERTYNPGVRYSTNWGSGTMGDSWTDNRNTNQKLLDLFTDKWREQNSQHIEKYNSLLNTAANLDFSNVRYMTETTKPTRKTSTSSAVEKLDLNQGVGMDYGAFIKGALANANHGADGVNFAKQFADGYKTELNNQLYDLDLASKLDDSMQTSEVLQQQLQYWEEYFDNLKALYQKDSDEYKAAEQQKADKTKELSGQILVARKKELDANAEKRKQELIAQQQAHVEALQNAWNGAASAISSVGSALQQIEDPRAKVAGIIAQAIANIAGTFAASLKGTFTPWDWIAGAAAGAATMASTIAAIKSATEYHAEGGFVGGPKGTDVTHVWATPGELILNEAQQSAVASRLATGSQSQQNGVGVVVEGEKMFTCLANYMNRSNKRLPV